MPPVGQQPPAVFAPGGSVDLMTGSTGDERKRDKEEGDGQEMGVTEAKKERRKEEKEVSIGATEAPRCCQ